VETQCGSVFVTHYPLKGETPWCYDPILFLLLRRLDSRPGNRLTLLENARYFVSGRHICIHRSVRSTHCVQQLRDK